MIKTIIIKFWPVFIPIILYFVWFLFFRNKKEASDKVSKLESKLWSLALITSLIIAIVTIIVLALSMESNKDSIYTPPKLDNGKVIPGKISPRDEQ